MSEASLWTSWTFIHSPLTFFLQKYNLLWRRYIVVLKNALYFICLSVRLFVVLVIILPVWLSVFLFWTALLIIIILVQISLYTFKYSTSSILETQVQRYDQGEQLSTQTWGGGWSKCVLYNLTWISPWLWTKM